MRKFSKTSLKRLQTCHPDLQRLANAVLAIHDCSVLEGYRDEETQNLYYSLGHSKVKFPNGKHNVKPSMAIDLAPYKKGQDTYDFEDVLFFAGIVLGVASEWLDQGLMQHTVRWGGTWSTELDAPFKFDTNGFYDGVHFELVPLGEE